MAKQKRKTIESFTDPLGQEYGPGDLVAISIISGRSPITSYGVVQNIFPEDTKGQEIMNRVHTRNPDTGVYEVIKTPACHVQVKVSQRTRWGGDGDDRLHTYKISDNITKINL